MKSKLLLIFVFQVLLWNCKSSSISKQDLIVENKVLKERLAQLTARDTTNIDAVVEVSNMNVVYRGVLNPMRITIPGAIKTEVSAPGLRKIDKFGNYTMVPQSGWDVEVLVTGIMPNMDTISVIKKLRIKDIKKLTGTINGYGCRKCEVLLSKKQLKKGFIESKLYDMLFDWKIVVKSFKIKFPKQKSIYVDGNEIKPYLNETIDALVVGDYIQIFDIKVTSSSGATFVATSPILIRIVED